MYKNVRFHELRNDKIRFLVLIIGEALGTFGVCDTKTKHTLRILQVLWNVDKVEAQRMEGIFVHPVGRMTLINSIPSYHKSFDLLPKRISDLLDRVNE